MIIDCFQNQNLKNSEMSCLVTAVLEITECFLYFIYNFINFMLQAEKMTPEAFQKFMEVEQKEEISVEEAQQYVKNFESTEKKTAFSKQGFTHFLMFNEEVEVVSSIARKEVKSAGMQHPLAHYWIASSHNT